jgi:hypothetical protein
VVHSDKKRGKSRSRILYWFRTPPGVKVGRSALDEDAIRQIEEFNPGVEFDWTRILRGQGAPPSEPRDAAPRPQGPRVERFRRDRPAQSRARGPSPVTPERPPLPADTTAENVVQDAALDIGQPGEESVMEESASLVPDLEIDPPTPAHARLGAEGVLRLRARYAEVLARISEKVADSVRREELKLQAERLNPDAWVTADEVTQGLEQYETVFASLREVVGRKRRRRRRRGGPQPQSGGGAGTPDGQSAPHTAESPEDAGDDDDSDTGDL